METVIEEKIEFVSANEAEKLDKMMTKDYVKRDANGKPTKSKDFVYRIISCHPYEKKDQFPPAGKFLIKVEVQKFHRNKFVEQKILISGKEQAQKVNKKVDGYEYTGITDNKFSPGGIWEQTDSDANRQIDLSEFNRIFVEDENE